MMVMRHPRDKTQYVVDLQRLLDTMLGGDEENIKRAFGHISKSIDLDGHGYVPRYALPDVIRILRENRFISESKEAQFWEHLEFEESITIDSEVWIQNGVNPEHAEANRNRRRRKKKKKKTASKTSRGKRKGKEEEEDEIESWGDDDDEPAVVSRYVGTGDDGTVTNKPKKKRTKKIRLRRASDVPVISEESESEFDIDCDMAREEALQEDLDDAENVADEGLRHEVLTFEQRTTLVSTNTNALNALVQVCIYLKANRLDESAMRQVERSERNILAVSRSLEAYLPLETMADREHVVIEAADGTEVRVGETIRSLIRDDGTIGYKDVTEEQRKAISYRASELHEEVYGRRPPKIRVMSNQGPLDINYYSRQTARETLYVAIREILGE